MRKLVLLVLLLVPQICSAGSVWQEGNFALFTGGWHTPDMAIRQGWVGLQMGLELPDAGILMIHDMGALEVYIPGKGWVRDRGIMIFNGSNMEPRSTQDTMVASATVTSDLRCAKERNRVLMIVRIPRVKTSDETIPTAARWVPRKETHYEAVD